MLYGTERLNAFSRAASIPIEVKSQRVITGLTLHPLESLTAELQAESPERFVQKP
jgi:hypothetical protein